MIFFMYVAYKLVTQRQRDACAASKNPETCLQEAQAVANCSFRSSEEARYPKDSLVCLSSKTGVENASKTNIQKSVNCFRADGRQSDEAKYLQLMEACVKRAGYKWRP